MTLRSPYAGAGVAKNAATWIHCLLAGRSRWASTQAKVLRTTRAILLRTLFF
jgi:hypothetical protein